MLHSWEMGEFQKQGLVRRLNTKPQMGYGEVELLACLTSLLNGTD
jgi:hypothetical protein